MLHIVEGASGSGKTQYLFDLFCTLANEGCKKLLYLIPEQSSFEYEKAFLRRLGAKICPNVTVVSFTRLYNFVMSETGGVSQSNIDDSMRKLLMACTFEDLKDHTDTLNIYKTPASSAQFIDVALTAVKEFKQCGILPQTLRNFSQKAGTPELENKLSELALIYEYYNGIVAQSGLDPYDNDMRLYQRLLDTGFLKDYVIAADEFSGFTAIQHKIIEVMMQQSSEFYISLCMPPQSNDDVFFTVARTQKRIVQSAQKCGVDIASPIRLYKNRRTGTEALMLLEQSLYRSDSETDDDVPVDGLEAVCAEDIYDECEYAAMKIKELALSGECRYRDIAVVVRESEKYEGVIDCVFEKHGIPFFMSRPESVDNKPIFRLAVSALEFVLSPNDEEKFINALKSGLMRVSPYKTAQLENYMFVWDLKGRDLFAEFTLDPKGFTDKPSDSSILRLKKLNEIREKAAAPFAQLLKKLDNGKLYTAREISLAVYEFMVDCGVPKILKAHSLEKKEFADEGLRLWKMLCELLNKMHDALGSRHVTLKRYYELFMLVIKGADISDIPQTLDQVIVGKADSVRFHSPYAVFVMGVLDGQFPRKPVEDGVFNDDQRSRLISLGLPLYDAVNELWYQEKFFVYNALSAARSRLFVSYPKSTMSGEPVQPSSVIDELKRIFPGIEISKTTDIPDIRHITNERTAFEMYSKTYSNADAFSKALERCLKDDSVYSDRLAVIGKSVKNLSERISNSDTANALFGSSKKLSPSQIEKFYTCRFDYFCSYGLHLKDRKKASLDRLVYGNLTHYILERIICAYIDNGCNAFSDEQLRELVRSASDTYFNEGLGGSGKDEKFDFLYNRAGERALRVAKHVIEELKRCRFKPVAAEQEIGGDDGIEAIVLEDENGNEITVNGKIDRVDMMETASKAWIRIIDYKSSGKKFSLDDVVNGLNMQMLIYLMTLQKHGGKFSSLPIEPAGVLYMKSDGSMVTLDLEGYENDDRINEMADAAFRSDHPLNGLFVDDDEVREGMNIPKKKEKGEVQYITAAPINKEQLAMVFDIIENKLLSMSEELDGGYISALPTRANKKTPCKWCEFRDICRREQSDSVRTIDKGDYQKALDDLKKAREEEGTTNE